VTLPFALAAASVALVGAARDVKTGHIPNWLTLGALGVAPLAHAGAAAARTGSLRAMLFSVLLSGAGAALCGAPPFALFARGALGGGDVKLFAAIGALAGPFVGFRAELIAFALGPMYALALAAHARRFGSVVNNVGSLVAGSFPSSDDGNVARELTPVRFGPVIFAGMLVSACLQWRAP
jgi:prepilin peptidase CpaA